MVDFDVIIAGAGPVGMTTALDLGQRGIHVLIVEKNATTTQHPKMDITNARSMELFHKLGITDELRAVAVPESNCFDVSWVTSMSGHELYRFKYDSPADIRAKALAHNDGSQMREPPMRVAQTEIEPVLYNALKHEPLVDIRHSTPIETYVDTGDQVAVTVRDLATDKASTYTCHYLVGADGGRSEVRTVAGIGLQGRGNIGQRYMMHFRSEDRDLLQRWGIAWHYQTPFGSIIAQNDHNVWTVHARLEPDDIEAPDPKKLLRKIIGRDIDFEMMVENKWSPNLLVADQYSVGRVFLAGDAAHQYIPTGGYGMNTGIGDASNLSWKLAAVIKGYGGAELLRSYAVERRAIGVQNCQASGAHANVRVEIAKLYVPEIFEDTTEGEAARAHAAKRIAELGNLENECWGIEHGFSYVGSPVVSTEYFGANALTFDPAVYTPSTRPGVRLPNVFLADGSAVYDQLGQWMTLLCLQGADTTSFSAAARALGVPLHILGLDDPKLIDVFESPLVLVRPDLHVAWRQSDRLDDATTVLQRAFGRNETSV